MSRTHVPLGEHIDVLSGFAFKSKLFNTDGHGLPLVRIRDVVPGRSSTFYDGPFDEKFVIADGDILIGMDGEFNCARWAGGRSLLNQRVCKVTPKNSTLDDAYLFRVLPDVLQAIEDQTPFVTVKHLSAKALREAEIPLPPLEEQKRIAAILDQADSLRRLRQRAIDRLNTLGQAIFYEMFGDPFTNPKGWKVSELGNLCEVVRGSSPRPQGDPAFFGGPVPRLMIADITRDGMRVTPSIDSLTEAGARRSRPMSAGSVVMAVSGAVGLPAILQVDACIHDGFVGFRSLDNRVVPEFLYQLLLVQREQNRAQGTGAIWVNLTTDQVKRFPVPLPSKEQQTLYLKKVASSYEASACCTAHSHYLEKLFSSLQHRAFRGEL